MTFWPIVLTGGGSFLLVGTPYAGVIPIEKALDPYGDAILAYEMNGKYIYQCFPCIAMH